MDFVCDLDGTVWLAGQAVPGVAEAVATAREAGHRFLFATNNSAARPCDIADHLRSIGIPATGQVVSSAAATAALIQPGERVCVIGGRGLREAIAARGAHVVDDGRVDVVAVGRDTSFDFAKLAAANAAIRSGARFLASNADPTFPTPEGLAPGGGAIVAAIATASGVEPVVAGKPFEPMAHAIREALGGDASDVIVVGDVPATDGMLARRLGVPFALVLSGMTTSAAGVDPVPDYVAKDLAELIRARISQRPPA